MDYSGFSNYSHSTPVSHHGDDTAAMDEPDRGGAKIPDSGFDILSFLSTALQMDIEQDENWTALVFFSIHLGPWNMFQPQNVYSGAYFSVTLISRKHLTRQTGAKLDYPHLGRRLLAVKTPKLRPDGHFAHNSKLLLSLAKEFTILKSAPLAKHENIVTVYGCCWQTLPMGPSQPTPTLIMEGTALGDLSNFSRLRVLTVRERLKLCLDATSGLEALHAHGVIHGDIKPANILVFNPWGRGYTAKLADFGSSILLSATNLPCQAPPGTRVYRAPECADESTRLGRGDLFKTDLFSLGVTIAFLLVGSHINNDMMAISDSYLQSLKEGSQLASWIIAHRHDRSAPVAIGMESSEWITDPSWSGSSIFSDDDLCFAFMYLSDKLLAGEASQRLESATETIVVLRHMVKRHVHTLRPFRSKGSVSKADGFAPDSASWARIAALTNISHARLRKLTGQEIQCEPRITREETIAISHCCDQPGSYLKEAKFIMEQNTKKEIKLLRSGPKRWQNKQAFPRPRSTRTLIPATVVNLANKMAQYVEESIDAEVQRFTDMKPVSVQKTIFKPSKVRNIYWILPHPVMELLQQQLLREAIDPRNSYADRADAAYEYAVFVLNVVEPTEERINHALELLTFAARNGHMEAQASVGRLSDVFGRPLAAYREEEMEWLLAASRAGSSVAQRRFRDLDIVGFKAAMDDVRQKNGSICPLLNQALLENSYEAQKAGDRVNIFNGLLHESAITGNVEILLKISPNVPSDFYECQNQLGETPLTIACRGGHASVVQILLSRGANAAHGTARGVTPLHFLAAFKDDDIPRVASALLEHGADVEKACERELIYKELFDSLFGQAGGTPLLWAVAAGNKCAVRALLSLGADPFTMERHTRTFGGYSPGDSPIIRAAVLHQLDLLQTIVSSTGNTSEFRKRFVDESAGCQSQGYELFCLAVDVNPGLRVREYILHGKEYQSVAVSCVRFLIDSGLDPTCFIDPPETRKNSVLCHPIFTACATNNTAMTRYLWDYQSGILRPRPNLWIQALAQSIFSGHKATFDFLVDHREDIPADVSYDVAAVAKTLTLTNDPYFTIGVLRLLREPGVVLSAEDAFGIFFRAVSLDHFGVARQVLETHGIDLTKRKSGHTLLHDLIAMSSDFPNMETRISFLLSLSPDKDALFWNVGYLDNTGLTALQAAAFMATEKPPMSPGAFATVLEHFNELKYMNAQLKGHPSEKHTGYTALHLAVHRVNIDAVVRLVEMPGIETNLQSSRGETPVDICVDIVHIYQTEGQTRFQLDETQRNKNYVCMSILDLLLNAKNEGRLAKYSTLLLRRTEDEFTVVDATRGKLHGVALSDLLESGAKMSRTCRSLVEEAPIGGIVAFSSSTLVLPVDLRRRIDVCWQARKLLR